MAQEFKPGEIVPQSGIYTITHDPAHADMPHEVTVIKGRRFPTCRPAHNLGPGCKEYWRLPFRFLNGYALDSTQTGPGFLLWGETAFPPFADRRKDGVGEASLVSYDPIPYASEQGIFLRLAGN